MTTSFYRLPPDLAADIDDFENDVDRFLAGDLPAGVLKAKRVPRGVYEQRRDGSFMVRVRVAGGTLTCEQTSLLAALATEYGNGLLHVTTRQDVQLHDIAIADTPAIMRRLMDVGLTSKGGGGNTVRNVAACPYAGACPAEKFNVTPLAHAVTEYLIPLVGSYNLPRKYKIAFSGCAADCALAQVSDLGFVAESKDDTPGFRVMAGGGMGTNSRIGDELLPWAPVTDVIRIAETIRRMFDKLGDRGNKHRARLRYVFERIGADEFRKQFTETIQTVIADDVPEWTGDCPTREATEATPPQPVHVDDVRCLAQWQKGLYTVPLHLPLGFLSADDFAQIGDIAGQFSDEKGPRTTRAQNMLIRSVKRESLAPLATALNDLSIDVLTAVPLERVVACAGASTCRLGLCLARGAARACAEGIESATVSEDTLRNLEIQINGCPNACGHQPIGAIGLLGTAQRSNGRLLPCYRITLGGRCGATGARLGTGAGQVPAKALPSLMSDIASDFESGREPGEAFVSYLDRVGTGHLESILRRHSDVPMYEEHPGFYRDFGVEEDFSLAGRGAGECGSGVFEVIQSDLSAAKKAEATSDRLLHTARALLITRGVDAQDPATVFAEFTEHFIDTGLVAGGFRALLSDEDTSGREEDIDALLKRVNLLYSTLDANLIFHPPDAPSASVDAGTEKRGDAGAELDLKGVACPMNFVKAKLRLEGMSIGESLAVILDDGAPIQNVPASFQNEGQEIEEQVDLGDGHWRIVVKKKH